MSNEKFVIRIKHKLVEVVYELIEEDIRFSNKETLGKLEEILEFEEKNAELK